MGQWDEVWANSAETEGHSPLRAFYICLANIVWVNCVYLKKLG